MHEDVTRSPLSWPTGWKRTPSFHRKAAMFGKRAGTGYQSKRRLDVGDGLDRLMGELKRLGASRIIVSSNLRLRNDGLPYAQQSKVLDDPGVAAYFSLGGKPRVLSCDRWNSAADNMAAIAGHIDAIRAQERYGVGTLDQAFAGYAALPPPETDPFTILGLTRNASAFEVKAAHVRLAVQHHPDMGGDGAQMARINAARDEALRLLGAVG